jgi:hypothetical protein
VSNGKPTSGSSEQTVSWDLDPRVVEELDQVLETDPTADDADDLAASIDAEIAVAKEWDELWRQSGLLLQSAVQGTVTDDGDVSAALQSVADLAVALDFADQGDTGDVIVATVITQLMGWLVGARDREIDTSAVLEWVHDVLGEEAHNAAFMVSRLIGHPLAPEMTMEEAEVRLETLFIPAMIWLAAGVTATAGGGDAGWLRQFDVPPEG